MGNNAFTFAKTDLTDLLDEGKTDEALRRMAEILHRQQVLIEAMSAYVRHLNEHKDEARG